MFSAIVSRCPSHFIRRSKSVILASKRWTTHTSDPDQKMKATVLNQEENAGLMIDAYSQVGFRLNNGLSVVGPIAIFPKSVLSWQVSGIQDIDEDSLSLFTILEPKIEILVIGIGDIGNRLDMRMIQYLREKKISVEILPTEAACTTFNFLNDERRYVAGALIPPYALKYREDDMLQAQLKRKKLFQSTADDGEIW
ncbi:unnamed protein product [Meganyctiphanes norvegica]|uniref:NADH dehydrogenase [ubiquinone] 1 alpha subcomplex assembly factor 3 n=1 Tax=Meganyctiphanes norvegica TaxID=48144 RepID=A0AAV2PJE0_MEGNR